MKYYLRRLLKECIIDLRLFTQSANKKITNQKRKIFILGTPTHGNLGDQAIAEAQLLFLKKYASEFQLLEYRDIDVFENIKEIKKAYKKGDIICFHGGGNFGDLYLTAQEQRDYIVKRIPQAKFVFFPQSSHFSTDKKGQQIKQLSEKVMYKKDIEFFSRESTTYKYINQNFSFNNYLIPDIVLSMKKDMMLERKYLTIAFRKDKEKYITEKELDNVIKVFSKYEYPVKNIDTHIGNDILIDNSNRKEVLNNFLTEIAQSKILVTDRLHGMIFGYITKTPTLVFNNNNHKINSSYTTWLEKVNYIEMISNNYDDFEIEYKIKKLMLVTPTYKSLDEYFEPLKSIFNGRNCNE
ncbi:polysaccharide pyruvyl transferase family protein [Vagococcus lutrae]|uniref:polysaccharide pyruvyl transferase family protein n=1 Tax=Vagococcus lutrae TaxID=81947 RepID=UPI00288EA3C8|nr:polysaccharide pyruvyl transferase family protein [Vagococcus lutrae]MDT2802006.1 polysaccharide pyruvyl transferase family protein [Vagococcus lutrae]